MKQHKYRYEIETWNDPMGDIDSSVTCFEETEAWDEYNTLIADGYYTRLLKIDEELEDTNWADSMEVIAANF